MNTMPSPDHITRLAFNEVFVFGSNRAGRHGKGAAKTALKWGARMGQGEGLMGHTYGLCTKDANIQTLSLREIQINAGAGFLVVLTGDIMRMPGLPSRPLAERIDVQGDRLVGLE